MIHAMQDRKKRGCGDLAASAGYLILVAFCSARVGKHEPQPVTAKPANPTTGAANNYLPLAHNGI